MQSAIIFDAYGTLFQLHPPIQELEAKLGPLATRLLEHWRQDILSKTWLLTLAQEWKDFDMIAKESLLYCFELYAISDQQLFDVLLSIYLRPSLFTDVLNKLKKLKAENRYVLILSNGTPEMLDVAMASCGITHYIDMAISAKAIQKYKVHPQVYQLAIDRLALAPSRIHFISSNTWDIYGATKFGFNTTWLNRQNVPYNFMVFPNKIISSLDQFNL